MKLRLRDDRAHYSTGNFFRQCDSIRLARPDGREEAVARLMYSCYCLSRNRLKTVLNFRIGYNFE